MRRCLLVLLAFPLAIHAQQSAPVQLTIYNDNFAVARTTIPLDLHAGENTVVTTDVTTQLEPDSVILRDPSGKRTLHILEQNYDAGIVTQEWLLKKYEGKTIQFQQTFYNTPAGAPTQQVIEGRIVRAGGSGNYGNPMQQPLIEVNGHLQFQLPGTPLFPADTSGLLLKPTLRWIIDAPAAERFPAELDYMTEGMSWQATYNVIMPETTPAGTADHADILGWVTLQNNSGTDFPSATIQLMAGDVAKIRNLAINGRGGPMAYEMATAVSVSPPNVTQKPFDDYHLYDLHRTLALPSGETKQVQFLEASGVTVERSYQFEDSVALPQPGYPGYHNISRDWGFTAKPEVSVREEIRNTQANHLGMPLPAGRIRLYRREASGQMQFVGENQITHTPENQSLHLVSGQSFDITGTRKQTDFHVDNNAHYMDESFSIKLSNAKSGPVTVHVVEHMNRAANWQITDKSADYDKQDSSTIDFPVSVPAKGDATLTYSVHYTWQ